MFDPIDLENLQRFGYSADQLIDLDTISAHSMTAAFIQYIQNDIVVPSNPFRVSPFQLFLSSHPERNALAAFHRERYYIVVHQSLIELVGKAVYKKFPALFPPGGKLNQVIEKQTNKSLSAFVFELITIYIYNHELGHLNQYKNQHTTASLVQEERCDLFAGNDFDPIRHAKEIDADIFAATEAGYSILAFWKTLPEIYRTTDLLRALVALFGAGIFLFWDTMQGGWSNLYFLEHTHPHIMVRATYILDCVTTVLHGAGDPASPFDRDVCQLDTLQLADQLLGSSQTNGLRSYLALFTGSVDDFEVYSKQHLTPISKQLRYLVQWNRPVPPIK
jgi:hypothetical protein